MKLNNWLLTSCYMLLAFYAVNRNMVAGSYCDCTPTYIESLPNGSNCPNETEWNSWTLNCTAVVVVANSTDNSTSNSTTNSTESAETAETTDNTTSTAEADALAIEIYKLTLHNYTAYNETVYPLNDTCTCNCTYGSYTNDTIYFDADNKTVTTVTESEETSTSDGTTTVVTTTVTNLAQIDGWWKVASTTTTVLTVTTTGGISSSSTASETAASNVTSHWLDVIKVVGNCNDPDPWGLHCHNCLYIPSMSNFSVCVDEQEKCPYMCSKTVYQWLGIEYYVSSCYNDSTPHECDPDQTCVAELCDFDYCNTWVPLSAQQHGINIVLLLAVLGTALFSRLLD